LTIFFSSHQMAFKKSFAKNGGKVQIKRGSHSLQWLITILKLLAQGGHAYWAFPFSQNFIISETNIFLFSMKAVFKCLECSKCSFYWIKTLQIVKHLWNAKIDFYLQTTFGQNSNPYLNAFFSEKSVKLRQLLIIL
jgi:hypothetical protein